MSLAIIGIALGLVASLALTRLMSGLLYGVSVTDPITFAAVSALLLAVALLAQLDDFPVEWPAGIIYNAALCGTSCRPSPISSFLF